LQVDEIRENGTELVAIPEYSAARPPVTNASQRWNVAIVTVIVALHFVDTVIPMARRFRGFSVCRFITESRRASSHPHRDGTFADALLIKFSVLRSNTAHNSASVSSFLIKSSCFAENVRVDSLPICSDSSSLYAAPQTEQWIIFLCQSDV
jgi:hypothetical protein